MATTSVRPSGNWSLVFAYLCPGGASETSPRLQPWEKGRNPTKSRRDDGILMSVVPTGLGFEGNRLPTASSRSTEPRPWANVPCPSGAKTDCEPLYARLEFPDGLTLAVGMLGYIPCSLFPGSAWGHHGFEALPRLRSVCCSAIHKAKRRRSLQDSDLVSACVPRQSLGTRHVRNSAIVVSPWYHFQGVSMFAFGLPQVFSRYALRIGSRSPTAWRSSFSPK